MELQNQPALQPSGSNSEMNRQLVGRQLLLLYFYHASKCSTSECQCRNGAYVVKYKLWTHMATCDESQCNYPCCSASRTLMRHHKRCMDKCCPICGPVRAKLSSSKDTQSSNAGATEFINSVSLSSNVNSSVGFNTDSVQNYRAFVLDTIQDEQTPIKRMVEPASSNCSQKEVRSSQASAKIPCEMQGLTHTQTKLSEQESHMSKSDPLKYSVATSACDRTLDQLAPTKRRKIGLTLPTCDYWEVEKGPSEMEVFTETQIVLQSGHDSRMMKSGTSVKPVPMVVEQLSKSQQAPFQQNCVLNDSTVWNRPTDHGKMQEKQKKTELGISFLANARKQSVKETMQVKQEVRSTPGFVGILSQKEGLAPMIVQVSLPTGHDSDMMKTEKSKIIKGNHINDKIDNLQPPVEQKYLESSLPTCSHKEAESKSILIIKGNYINDKIDNLQPPVEQKYLESSLPTCSHKEAESKSILVTAEIPCEMEGISQKETQKRHPKRHNLDFKNSSSLVYIEQNQQTENSQGPFQKIEENTNALQNLHAKGGLIQERLVKQDGQESMQDEETAMDVFPFDQCTSRKFGKPKKTELHAVSLIEVLNCEQIREHITGLQQQSKQKPKNKKSKEMCSLCNAGKLTFHLPPLKCSLCEKYRIKYKTMYYSVVAVDARNCICKVCYDKIRDDVVKIDDNEYAKSMFKEQINEEVAKEEEWVQCYNCKEWQHIICALLNVKRKEEGIANYTCLNCYIEQIERGVWKAFPQNAILQAKDLPRTFLSDHIEQRLFRCLKEERQERAQVLGKDFEEVLGAGALVVRVVNSKNKVLKVKQKFLDMFQHQNYSSEFPYKSKVLLLFQEIEGIEVCLFGIFVQEYGSECSHPNQRRIYISYLDSVKYFRPYVKTIHGESLRTFVYHEILMGYLDYCKSRGFTSCYIWACPPLRGDDYIFYCHPRTQKTPKSDTLREWYLKMLHKAKKEGIVVDVTNMYDYFFASTGERKTKVTAACLPYFDGDHWPEAAEKMIMQIQREEADGQKYQKNKKHDLLMKKLGHNIRQMKEDLIMVHLQHACTHCCSFIVSGKRWVCKQCKTFQLCEKCYEAEKKLDERKKHPVNNREKHMLFPIEVTNIPADTKDKDEIMENEFFDTRQSFLSLCEGNHYQYDTLRRAKHSSMMLLYHLHNPTAPSFVSTCNICLHDIETGQGLRCAICPDYDICNICYKKDEFAKHPHKLFTHPSAVDQDAQNQEGRQHGILQLREILDLVIHASRCFSPQCAYQNCRKVKGLFFHGKNCEKGAAQGCGFCKEMWHMLGLHARACKETKCHVPRCKDLKWHFGRSQSSGMTVQS